MLLTLISHPAFAIIAFAMSVLGTIGLFFANLAEKKSDATVSEKRHTELLSGVEQVQLAMFQKAKSLRDKLWKEYPHGYVLYGGDEGDVVSMPFYDGSLSVNAWWEEAKFQIFDTQKGKYVKITLPQPRWKSPNVNIVVGEAGIFSAPFKEGVITPNSLVHIEGEPNLHFEVLKADPRRPIYVLGIK